MIVVDSSVWIDNIRNADRDHVRRLEVLDENQILLGDIILLEVLQGARSEADAKRLERFFSVFPIVSMLHPTLAPKVARNHRRLRVLGITVRKTTDLIIGTFCIEFGHHLLQNDRDFQPMAQHLGLQLA